MLGLLPTMLSRLRARLRLSFWTLKEVCGEEGRGGERCGEVWREGERRGEEGRKGERRGEEGRGMERGGVKRGSGGIGIQIQVSNTSVMFASV